MLLLLAIACTEPIWYPEHPEPGWTGPDDSADPLDTTDPGDTEDTGPELPCSGPGTDATSFTANNSTAGPLVLYWRDQSCAELAYGTIAAGSSQPQGSYVQHVWVLRTQSGQYVDHLVLDSTTPAEWTP